MAILNKGTNYQDGDQVTSVNLNNHVDDATFAAGAVDNASTQLSGGAIIVRDEGITTAKLADGAVTANKLAAEGVELDKLEPIADYTVLGNTSGAAASPTEVLILDEDDMASDSDTAVATQQSIKAYVDTFANSATCLVSSSDASINAPGVPFIIPFNFEISDATDMHDNAVNNSRITIARPNIYLINGTIATTETDNGDYSIAIYKNGSELVRTYFNSPVTTQGQTFGITHLTPLSTSDYLELVLYAISGNSTTIVGTQTFFNVSEIL